MSMLVWMVSNALAATPITFPCGPPYPCAVPLLSGDHNIFPPDKLRIAAAEIAPTALEWMEITLTMTAGTLEVTVDGIYLDPRAGIQDLRAGTTRWVVPVGNTIDGIAVDLYNPSSRTTALYDLVGKVYVEHR